MATNFSAKLLLILSSLTTFVSPANSQSPVTTYPSPSGYRITITKPVWRQQGQATTTLSFDFTLSHADGSAVAFISNQNAIRVSGWTETNFDATTGHSTVAYPINNSEGSAGWHVDLPGLDPRDKIAHIEFDVKAPETPDWASNQLVSDIRFDHIPIPSQPDVTEPLNDTFTSDWNTVITLTGLTQETKDKQSDGPAVRWDLQFDHTKVPDDQIHPAIQKVFDNGIALDDFSNFNWATPDSTGQIHLVSHGVLPQSSPGLSIDFRIQEDAESITSSILWTPLGIGVPLGGIAPPLPSYHTVTQNETTIDGVQYAFKHIASNNGQDSGYLLATQSPSPTEFYRFTDIAWTPIVDTTQYTPPVTLVNNLYWNTDGTPDKPGEYQTYLPLYNFSNWRPNFPLLATVTEETHDQQILSFTKIPVPANGETLVVRRNPTPSSTVPLVLKSIAWNPPVKNTNGENQNSTQDAYALILTFEYVTQDKSSLNLVVVNARDTANDEIDTNELVDSSATANLSSVDPDQRIFTVETGLPPHGSRFISLKVILTRDHPVSAPVRYSIDSSGVFTVVPLSVTPTASTH